MGTSASFGGPAAQKKLLPDWAFAGGDAGGPDSDDAGGDGEPGTDDANGTGDDASDTPDSPSTDPAQPRTQPNSPQGEASDRAWQTAKASLTRFARGTGGGGQGGAVRTAGRNYIRARGGSRAATQSSHSGRSVAAGVGSFLSTVANRGINAALESIGLGKIVGQSIESVCSAIADAISPDGSHRDDTAARRAANDTLYRVYKKFADDTQDIKALNSVSGDDVRAAIRDTVSAYIFSRWLEELGISIEKGATSASSAVGLERQVKQYVRERVRFDTTGSDVLKVNWSGREGSQIIERIFDDAHSFLEMAK